MSWFFGGGGNNNNNDKKNDSSSSSISDPYSSSSFDAAPSSTFGTELGGGSSIGSSSLGGSSNAKMDSFQQELIAEQQKAVIQAVMFKLTDVAFDQCVPKPSSALSSSEQSCIAATVGKYLETTELIVGRFQNEH